nr:immunoglobulin heavy chain junction region [Macaca mulatta]
CAREGGYFDLW